METLLSDAYNDARRKLIDRQGLARIAARLGRGLRRRGQAASAPRACAKRSAPWAPASRPSARVGEVRGDTVHFDIVDRDGNMVSATPSGGWLQSSPVIPELGFCLGTRGQMFWLEDGHPAALAPGKRPRTTLSPTMALRDGEPYLAWGTPGGDQQDQWTTQFFLRHVHAGSTCRRRSTRRPGIPSTSRSRSGRARRAPACWWWRAGSLPTAARSSSDRGHVVEVGPTGRRDGSPQPHASAAAAAPPPIRAACRAMRPGADRAPRFDNDAGSNRVTAMIRLFAATLALVATLVAPGLVAPASAADYPTRPVTLIVAFTPGGPSDVLARIVGRQLEKILGQTFVIDNRPGGAGNIAAEVVAHAAPDGYTLLMGNNGLLATNQSLFKKLGFDGEKDFAPISLIGSQPNILVVNPKFPARTMAELIAYAKANPGKLNYANSGFGAAAHLSAELFKSEAKVDIVSVSYKGAAPALQDLIAGHTQVMFATSASVVGFLKSGTLRPLAVTTLKRFSLMPDLPTVAELGLPGFDATTWHGLVAPAGTPRPVIETLNRAMVQALADPDTVRQLHDLGVEVGSSTPEEFAAYIKSEIPKWAAVVKASGAQVE